MPKKVISLGGSLINPGKIQVKFLKKLRQYLLKSPHKFILVCGGGKPARDYAKAGKKFGLNTEELDEIGIAATLLNAELVSKIFSAGKVQTKPVRKNFDKFLIAGGWKTGASSDYDAIKWAAENGIKEVINLTNVDYVYTKDPSKKGAKPIKNLNWNEFRKLIGGKWKTGIHAPFDPVAARTAQQLDIKVICMNGKKLSELRKRLQGKTFKGTVIQ